MIVDIRRESATFGQWEGFTLSGKKKNQLFIPEGFAHGYCVLSKTAIFFYKCSDYYAPDCEKGILWSDTGLRIEWPVEKPLLSDKDRKYPCLGDVPPDELPGFR